ARAVEGFEQQGRAIEDRARGGGLGLDDHELSIRIYELMPTRIFRLGIYLFIPSVVVVVT
ncbi:hypothetical protein ACWGMO_34810, partial [Nocardia salmonicida]